MKVLVDNGHGYETPGKKSLDGRLLEYAYSREIARLLVSSLKARGIDAEQIVQENNDISLKERCRRINEICAKLGSKNCICISIHNNADAGTKWSNSSGFSVFVSPNASANSKKLASIFTDTSKNYCLEGNRAIPKEKYWTKNLAICRDTNCPAVLTENLFMTNKSDVDFLLSNIGKKIIAKMHEEAVIEYIKQVS